MPVADSAPTRQEPVVGPPAWVALASIAIVMIVGYAIAPTRLPLMGEEPCRALHGIEMARTGDWIIATNQGIPILDRPPLQYWTLALIHGFLHPLDPLTVRLSMVVMTFVTALLVWWYARGFLSPTGALVASVAYPTMGIVFDLGRRAETDALFGLLLAAALMAWHYGFARGWSPWATWTSGAALAAAATLTKGIQGPVAFFGAVYVYLLLRRERRFLLHPAHGAGLLLFVALIAVWQVPFYLQTGWEGTRSTWLDPGGSRLSVDLGTLLRHLASFPVEALGAGLPWSVLALGLLHRGSWRPRDPARSAVVFQLLGIAAIFGPVWISIGGEPRYVMPVYPLLAFLVGAVAQRCLAEDAVPGLRRLWRGFFVSMAILFSIAAIVVLGANLSDLISLQYWSELLAQPWPMVVALTLGTALAAYLMTQARPSAGRMGRAARPLALAFVLALYFNGPVLDATARPLHDLGVDVAALRRGLPPDVRLHSFGPADVSFVYYWQDTIPIVPRSATAAAIPGDLDYFVVSFLESETIRLPFDWEPLARLNVNPRASPSVILVVGRRLAADPRGSRETGPIVE